MKVPALSLSPSPLYYFSVFLFTGKEFHRGTESALRKLRQSEAQSSMHTRTQVKGGGIRWRRGEAWAGRVGERATGKLRKEGVYVKQRFPRERRTRPGNVYGWRSLKACMAFAEQHFDTRKYTWLSLGQAIECVLLMFNWCGCFVTIKYVTLLFWSPHYAISYSCREPLMWDPFVLHRK